MAYGVSKSISENHKLGDKYVNIKKVISINITKNFGEVLLND
jgi:hypothetical protein